MDQQLNKLTDWLQNAANQTLWIEKKEQDDVDQTELTLERVGFRKAGERPIDDYVDGSAILLHGHGSVINGKDKVPLPQNMYVIPVHGLENVSLTENSTLTLQTERAHYTLHLQ